MILRKKGTRLCSLFVLLCFVIQLSAPCLLQAKEKERWDSKLLSKLASRVEVILEKVCKQVSKAPGNEVVMKTFLCDDRHRVFADIAGSVTIKFPRLLGHIKRKFQGAVGSCLSTNGPLAMDFAVHSFEKVEEKTYRLDFRMDLILTLKEIVRTTLVQAANVVGSLTIGALLSKFVTFCNNVDANALGIALRKATTTLWALGAGKMGIEAYDMLDKTGKVKIKKMLVETFTLRSLIYHFGVFMLKSAVAAGGALAKMGVGAAIASSLAGGIGVFIGAALTVAAVSIIGKIIVTKLTIDLPMWWRFRKLRKLHESRKAVAPGSEEDEEILQEMDEVESHCIVLLDEELALDRFKVLDKLIAKLGNVYEEGDLAPYEGLIEKLKNKLSTSSIYDENWNASRKYYQLLEAIGRLPFKEGKGSVSSY